MDPGAFRPCPRLVQYALLLSDLNLTQRQCPIHALSWAGARWVCDRGRAPVGFDMIVPIPGTPRKVYEKNHSSSRRDVWKYSFQGRRLRAIGESSWGVFGTAKQLMELCKAATNELYKTRKQSAGAHRETYIHTWYCCCLVQRRYTRLSDCLFYFQVLIVCLLPGIGRKGCELTDRTSPTTFVCLVHTWYLVSISWLDGHYNSSWIPGR